MSRWHLSRQHLFWWHLSISWISQLLMARFWPKFKGRFLEPSLTDANHYGDNCPVNICPGGICPYQEYLSCYWLNVDVGSKIIFHLDIFYLKSFDRNFLDPRFFWPQNFFGTKIFLTFIFLTWIVFNQQFLYKNNNNNNNIHNHNFNGFWQNWNYPSFSYKLLFVKSDIVQSVLFVQISFM